MTRLWLICSFCGELFEDGDFAIAGGDAFDRLDLAGGIVIAKSGAENVVGGHDAFERGLDHFFGRGGDDVEIEFVSFQAVQELREQADVGLEADAFAGFDEMLATDAAVLGVVQNQVGEFASLLDQMDIGEAGNLLLKTGNAQHLAQNNTRVMKTQGLIKVTGD